MNVKKNNQKISYFIIKKIHTLSVSRFGKLTMTLNFDIYMRISIGGERWPDFRHIGKAGRASGLVGG